MNVTPSKREFIITKCIKNDVGVFTADNTEEAHKFLTSRSITHILVDLGSKASDWLGFLKQLRETEEGFKYQIIIISIRKEREFIQSLLYLGIVGFIAGDLSIEKIYEKLDSLIKISEDRDKRRKHFRVNVTEQDEVKINFKKPNQDKLITGKVTDISIVAAAFQVDDESHVHNFSAGDVIDKVQLKINTRFALVSLKIIKTGPISVGMFLNLSENALNLLTQYIFDAMSR
jgi:response regulator of citrate/malate metabolism